MGPIEFTPDRIEALTSNQIFVFGSNLAGRHGGGAARLAAERFGATFGVGIGREGQSYALPTLNENFEKLPLDETVTQTGIVTHILILRK